MVNMEMDLTNTNNNIKGLYVFTKAINYLLEENSGIVIDVEVDWMKNSYEVDKVILYKTEGQILIIKCDTEETKNVKEGQIIKYTSIPF
jgi:hypothetical protein